MLKSAATHKRSESSNIYKRVQLLTFWVRTLDQDWEWRGMIASIKLKGGGMRWSLVGSCGGVMTDKWSWIDARWRHTKVKTVGAGGGGGGGGQRWRQLLETSRNAKPTSARIWYIKKVIIEAIWGEAGGHIEPQPDGEGGWGYCSGWKLYIVGRWNQEGVSDENGWWCVGKGHNWEGGSDIKKQIFSHGREILKKEGIHLRWSIKINLRGRFSSHIMVDIWILLPKEVVELNAISLFNNHLDSPRRGKG